MGQKAVLHYTFADPIDAAELREQFDFPPSIRLSNDGVIKDGPNRFDIYYDRPAKPMSFEGLPATAAPMQSPQAALELPAADDGTADERLRQIVEKMRPELGG